MKMISVFPYIGGKQRMARHIVPYLKATGAEVLVDVFGGSAAVLLNAGFQKRIYNDLDGDLVHLFRVLSDPAQRQAMIKRLRWRVPSRLIFIEEARDYIQHGFSFRHISDPIERAARVFYRQQFCFGGKGRSGGFSVSDFGRPWIKEVSRYRNTLRRLVQIGEFFRDTLIECLDFQDCVLRYGRDKRAVLFVDPPYFGTENYYSTMFDSTHHGILAHLLHSVPAPVVCTYYDHPHIRDLYPERFWEWNAVIAVKNSQNRVHRKEKVTEYILVKRHES